MTLRLMRRIRRDDLRRAVLLAERRERLKQRREQVPVARSFSTGGRPAAVSPAADRRSATNKLKVR
jgi:hypothetical protein